MTDTTRTRPYYEGTELAHDDLMRCKDCQRLVPCARLRKTGGCPNCGNRRFTEVRTLTLWEWAKIRMGLIRFENKKEFLKEFSHER